MQVSNNNEIIDWLLQGDVSIQYQAYRDLLGEDRNDLQQRIATEGWGAEYLSNRNANEHWGRAYYQPKWISSHYTLLDLKNLCIAPDIPAIHETLQLILKYERGPDNGINPSRNIGQSDVCLNGMFLNFASYFEVDEQQLIPIVDFILSQRMPDGGFNCRKNRSGAKHSSLHSTLSVAEGIAEYRKQGYTYRLTELKNAEVACREFILLHQLFISDRTGAVINQNFLRFPYPSRWKYDILRALDYFQASGVKYDQRIQPAIDVLLKKRGPDGRWKLQAKHPGQIHFEMEKAGQPSRWNTLRALRVLKHFKVEEQVVDIDGYL